jgi:hypothetical protein
LLKDDSKLVQGKKRWWGDDPRTVEKHLYGFFSPPASPKVWVSKIAGTISGMSKDFVRPVPVEKSHTTAQLLKDV